MEPISGPLESVATHSVLEDDWRFGNFDVATVCSARDMEHGQSVTIFGLNFHGLPSHTQMGEVFCIIRIVVDFLLALG